MIHSSNKGKIVIAKKQRIKENEFNHNEVQIKLITFEPVKFTY